MDQVFSFIHDILPFFHVVAGIIIIAKFILVMNNKGVNVTAVMLSFFRIYSKSDRLISNKKRREFMLLNNYFNVYLYLWLFVCLIIFIIFQGNP